MRPNWVEGRGKRGSERGGGLAGSSFSFLLFFFVGGPMREETGWAGPMRVEGCGPRSGCVEGESLG